MQDDDKTHKKGYKMRPVSSSLHPIRQQSTSSPLLTCTQKTALTQTRFFLTSRIGSRVDGIQLAPCATQEAPVGSVERVTDTTHPASHNPAAEGRPVALTSPEEGVSDNCELST